MRETIRKIKKLFVFALIGTILLQSMIVYADKEGNAEIIEGVYPYFIPSDNKTYCGITVNQYMGITINIPYIDTTKLNGGTIVKDENIGFINDILNLGSGGRYDASAMSQIYDKLIEYVKRENMNELATFLEDWKEELGGSVGEATGMHRSLTDEEVETISRYVAQYNPASYLKVVKEGYSLANYYVTNANMNSDSIYNIGGLINFNPYQVEPIFEPTRAQHIKVSELNEGDILPAGSLIYSELVYGQPKCPRIFVSETENQGGQNYAQLMDAAPTDYLESMFRNNYSDVNNNSFIVNKVPSEYKTESVALWKVVKIYDTTGDSITNGYPVSSQFVIDFPKYNSSKDISDTTGSTLKEPSKNSSYPLMSGIFIQLEPYADTMILNNPQVSVDGFNLKLKTVTPTSNSGVDYSGKTADVVNKFYVTTDMTQENINESLLQNYSDSMNRILHPGTYRVFHQATCNGAEPSQIRYNDITIYPPIVAAPTISVSNQTVTYTPNGVSTDSKNALQAVGLRTDYSSVESTQQLIRVLTQKKDYDVSGLPQSGTPTAFAGTTDTLKEGYNRIFAYSALTIGQSMQYYDNARGMEVYDEAKTYYSGPADKTIDWTSPPSGGSRDDSSTSSRTNTQVIENVKTGDDSPFIKWCLLFLLGTALIMIPVIDYVKSKKKSV